MNKVSESYRLILRASTIIGGASVVNILVGLVRIKVVAVLLGPAGVGAIGLLQNMMTVATNLASLGFRTVGTRQIAEASGKNDDVAVTVARRALFWGTMGLALVGAFVFWLLRGVLAEHILHEPTRAGEVGWIAIGVALSVAAGSQTALLTGLHQIGNLVRAGVASSFLSTLLGISVLMIFGERGVIAFVLVTPVTSFILGHWYVRKLDPVRGAATPVAQLMAQWRIMIGLGVAFMMTGVISSFGELLVRILLKRDLGIDAVGQFQAAWMISMTYTGVVISAMGADYFPRLTAIYGDDVNCNRLVNEQTEVALLFAGPILLVILGLAPWVVTILYSAAFDNTVAILRWQLLGDVMKVASWPLGYLILASGDGRSYLISESAIMVVYVVFTWMALPFMGIQATGAGFFLMYMTYLPLAFWLGHRRTGFLWVRHVALLLAGLIIASVLVFLGAIWSKWLGAVLGCCFALILGIYGIDRLGRLVGVNGRAGKIITIGNWVRTKIGIHATEHTPPRPNQTLPEVTKAFAVVPNDHPRYRPDIDGLRAIAVLSVVGFHAAPGRIPGGFIGVDIFFVISGFLISTIIINGLNNNHFSFLEFYIRRIKRIFPALLLVFFATLLTSTLILVDSDYRAFGKHIASGAFFVSNFTLWFESGYFDSAANFKPLLHLWSLGIEEQFYIFWPLLLWCFAKRKGGFLVLTITVALISFALNIYQVGVNQVADFYSPLTRFWELLLGCGLTLLIKRGLLSKDYQRNIVSLVGAILLALAFILINKDRSFPGWWSLLPTFGAALLILAGPAAWLNRFFLSNRVFVWFGLISFPLYLWHWPILSFLRILVGTEIEQSIRLVAVAVSIGLAWFTFKFVEIPIRKRSSTVLVPKVLIVMMGLTGLAGVFIYNSTAFNWRPLKPVIMNVGEVGHDQFLNVIHEKFYPCTPIEIRNASDSWKGITRCFQSKPLELKNMAIIGDSHAEHLFPGLADRLGNRNIVFYGMDGLPFLSNPDYAKIYAYVVADRNISEVVIAAVWDRKLRQLAVADWRLELTRTISHLTNAGKRVYLVDDVPKFSFLPNRCKYAGRLGIENKCTEKDDSIIAIYTPIFREIAAADNAVRLLSIHGVFCKEALCRMAQDGNLLFRDEHHLTLTGSMKAADAMIKQM